MNYLMRNFNTAVMMLYIYIKIKDDLNKMLIRENRIELYESCIKFLKTRIKLDQSGFTEDIFSTLKYE